MITKLDGDGVGGLVLVKAKNCTVGGAAPLGVQTGYRGVRIL